MIFSILIFSVVLTPLSFGYGGGGGGGGSVLDPKVCGDRLCSEIPGGRNAWESKETVPLAIKNYPDLGVKVETVAMNLSIPWSIDFAPDGRIFFSERTGTLQVIDDGIQKQIMSLNVGGGEGGMLGIALDPDFESNHYVYIYYTYNEFLSTKNKLVRYVESNNSLTEDKILLEDIPGASYHDGGRIKFGPDNKLYITTGDAGDPNLSQNLDSVAGKILRINSDGTIPDDNPFDSAVYSYGHRNPQGIDWSKSGVLIGTEHGPSGERGVAHDEINLIEAGKNYGWPDVIGDETKEELTNPILHSGDDTWAPSGAAFYYGEISQWNGLYFVASLRGEHLLAVDFDSEYNVISFEKLFLGEFGRLRAAVNGPDGLYVLTSNQDGRGNPTSNDDRILRITPIEDTIPGWIQNIFDWYEEDKISEDEMRNAIEYLMNKGILKDDYLEKESTIPTNLGLPYSITELDLIHGTSHPFGVYRFSWETEPHPGIDLQPITGATIFAMDDGKIVDITIDNRFENYKEVTVQIDDSSWAVLYESIIPNDDLVIGQLVEKGDTIGIFNGGYAKNPGLLHVQLTSYPGEFSGYKGESVCWINNLKDDQRLELESAWNDVKNTDEFLDTWENNQVDGTYFLKGLSEMYDGAKMCYDDVDVRTIID